MKKSFLFLAAASIAFAACDPEGPTSNVIEHLDETQPTIEYAGETYKVVKIDGRWWMAENLRYVPEGITPSGTPGDSTGVWYPYSLSGAITVTANPDTALVATDGYLYDIFTATGNANPYTIDTSATGAQAQVKALEGVQGVCPDGWHLPTNDEYVALLGESTIKLNGASASVTIDTAPCWNGSMGSLDYADSLGFNSTLAGSITNNKYTIGIVASGKGSAQYVGKKSVNFFVSSTLHVYKSGALITKLDDLKYEVAMTSFTSTYKGRLAMADGIAFKTAGAVRCIKNQK